MSDTIVYPCDAGTGWPMGYHSYTVTDFGVVCSLCGHRPTSAIKGEQT